jgi:hypothetical protein
MAMEDQKGPVTKYLPGSEDNIHLVDPQPTRPKRTR